MCKYMWLCCCQKSGRGALCFLWIAAILSLSALNLTANLPQRAPTGFYVAQATLFAARHVKMNMEFLKGPLENKGWPHSGRCRWLLLPGPDPVGLLAWGSRLGQQVHTQPPLLPGSELCSLGRAEGQGSRHSWLGPEGATVEQADLRWDVAEKAVRHVSLHRRCVMA